MNFRNPSRRELLKGLALGSSGLALRSLLNRPLMRGLAGLGGAALASAPLVAHAAPAISGHSGSAAHNGSLTLTGTGFGTKATAAPLIWDNCSHGQAHSVRWTDAWPNVGGSWDIAYRTPGTGNGRTLTTAAHNRVTHYLCGANNPDGAYNNGWNCLTWRNVPITWPTPVFMSWWYRLDPTWNTSGDDNHKWADYSKAPEPMDPNNWYFESAGGPAFFNSHILDDDGVVGWTTDEWYGLDFPVNPISAWVKMETEVLFTNTTAGFIHHWVNGSQLLNLNGDTTDGDSFGANGANRAIAIGGYSRTYHPSHWRYFNDLYMDTSRCRAVLGNASTLAACTVKEIQIPTTWGATSLTVTVNRGVLADSGPVYAYVYDDQGVANSAGFDVSGAGGAASSSRASGAARFSGGVRF